MIRSTFAGFAMATQALLANQKSLDVTGQNLSNINNEGYARQRLDLVSIPPTGMSPAMSIPNNNVGQGVLMTGVTQIRDPFLDVQYRNQITKVGTFDARDMVLEDIGNIFDETDSVAVRALLDEVISQLKNIASTENVGDESLDIVVRGSIETFITATYQNAVKIEELEEEYSTRLEDTMIPEINTILERIGELNESIKLSEIFGGPALELKDERNLLIDDLASYLPIDVEYRDSEARVEGVDELFITFKDSDGNVHNLISDDDIAEFSLTINTTSGAPYEIRIKDALDPTGTSALSTTNVASLLGEGVLKGNLDMLNKAGIFDGTDYRGINYYVNMLDTFVVTMVEELNEMNTVFDAAGNIIAGGPLFETKDDTQPLSALNFKISEEWASGEIQILKTKNDGVGGTDNSTDYENVLKMIDFLTNETISFSHTNPDTGVVVNNVFTGTIQDVYDGLQNIQATDRAGESAILQNGIAVLSQIADSRESVFGVNQDEETMNLMRFQQSYNAAARLMTTMDEILDKLINQTGIAGR